MKKFVRWLIVGILAWSLLVLLSGCGGQQKQTAGSSGAKQAQQEDALAFYKGKVLNVIVPYATGGGYDQYVRLVAPYLQKYIPGTTVVVRNVPGAGSLTGTNELYLAKPDGLTIGVINGVGMVTDQAVGLAGVKFDLNKFIWLGRFIGEPQIVVISANAPYKSLDELKKAPGPLKFSVPGVGSSMYVTLEVFKKIALPQMEIVPGYNTSAECDVAMLRGEVIGTAGSISSKTPLLESKKAVPIALFGRKRSPVIPDVPRMDEITTGKEQEMAAAYGALLDVGRPMAAPPGVPEERVKVLRDAFAKALQDPEFLDKAKQAQLEIEYLSGDETAALIKESLHMNDELKNLMAQALKS